MEGETNRGLTPSTLDPGALHIHMHEALHRHRTPPPSDEGYGLHPVHAFTTLCVSTVWAVPANVGQGGHQLVGVAVQPSEGENRRPRGRQG